MTRRTSAFAILAGAVATFLAVPHVPARAAFMGLGLPACAAKAAPSIRVVSTPPEYRIDHSLGHDEIGALARSGNIVFGVRQYAPGLTTATIGSSVSYAISSFESRQGWCSVADTVEVRLALEAPAVVYVDKVLSPSGCAYSAILQHEMKHVATYARTLDEGRPRITALLRLAVEADPPSASASSVEASRERLASTLAPVVQAAVGDTLRFAAAMNRAIDTPEEYARVQSSCRDLTR